MKNKMYSKTVEGVAQFLVDVEKTFKPSISVSNTVVRSGRDSRSIYPSKLVKATTKSPVSYRLLIIPEENKSTVRLIVGTRQYAVTLNYMPPHSGTTSYMFSLPQETIELSVDLSKYTADVFSAEQLIDLEMEKLLRRDALLLFTGEVKDEKNEWKLTVERNETPMVSVSSAYQL